MHQLQEDFVKTQWYWLW